MPHGSFLQKRSVTSQCYLSIHIVTRTMVLQTIVLRAAAQMQPELRSPSIRNICASFRQKRRQHQFSFLRHQISPAMLDPSRNCSILQSYKKMRPGKKMSRAALGCTICALRLLYFVATLDSQKVNSADKITRFLQIADDHARIVVEHLFARTFEP